MQYENFSPEFLRIFNRYKKSIKYIKPETLGKSIDRLLQDRNKKALLKKDEYDLFYQEAMREFNNKIEGSFNQNNNGSPSKVNKGYDRRKTILDKNHLIKIFENPDDNPDTIQSDIVSKFNRQLAVNQTTFAVKKKEKEFFIKISSDEDKNNPKLDQLKNVIENFPQLRKSIKKIFHEENKFKGNKMKNQNSQKPLVGFDENELCMPQYKEEILTEENRHKLEKALKNLSSANDTAKILKLIEKNKKLDANMQKIQKYESQILKSNRISLKFIEHNEKTKKQLENKYKRVMEKHFN